MMKNQEGCLVVILLKGEFEHDLDLFNKMDPYCVFKLNDQNARSQVKDEAGKTPDWNESFSFRCKEGDILYFTVFDKDPKSDDEVGSGSVNVHRDFIDNRSSYLYPVTLKGKPAGTVALQMTFLPDDTEVLSLVQSLQKELDDKRAMICEIKADIEENLKNPPRPKPESLLMKNLLDIFENKKKMDKQFIDESISKAEAPFLGKLKELNAILDQMTKKNEEIQLQNAESLDLVNQASYDLSLYKSLSEKGMLKIKIMNLELINDKKYDAYVAFLIDRQIYKTSITKNMKKSAFLNSSLEAKRINDDLINISVFDDCIGNDDLLGTGAVDLIPVVLGKKPIVFNVELGLKQKRVGFLNIEVVFVKDN